MCQLALFLLREDRTEGKPLVDYYSTGVGTITLRAPQYNRWPAQVAQLIGVYMSASTSGFQARVIRV